MKLADALRQPNLSDFHEQKTGAVWDTQLAEGNSHLLMKWYGCPHLQALRHTPVAQTDHSGFVSGSHHSACSCPACTRSIVLCKRNLPPQMHKPRLHCCISSFSKTHSVTCSGVRNRCCLQYPLATRCYSKCETTSSNSLSICTGGMAGCQLEWTKVRTQRARSTT